MLQWKLELKLKAQAKYIIYKCTKITHPENNSEVFKAHLKIQSVFVAENVH